MIGSPLPPHNERYPVIHRERGTGYLVITSCAIVVTGSSSCFPLLSLSIFSHLKFRKGGSIVFFWPGRSPPRIQSQDRYTHHDVRTQFEGPSSSHLRFTSWEGQREKHLPWMGKRERLSGQASDLLYFDPFYVFVTDGIKH